MKKRDIRGVKILIVFAVLTIGEAVKSHDYAGALGAYVLLAGIVWLFNCYKRTQRAKVTAITTFALAVLWMVEAWWANSGAINPFSTFSLIFVISIVLWWHAKRADTRVAQAQNTLS